VEKYPPIASSIEYPNIDIFYFGFVATQKWRERIAL
jgi:hypothetical protein